MGAGYFRFPCQPYGEGPTSIVGFSQAAGTRYSSGIGKVSVPSLELLSTLTAYK